MQLPTEIADFAMTSDGWLFPRLLSECYLHSPSDALTVSDDDSNRFS